MRGVFLEHPSSMEHATGRHPEAAGRIAAIESELGARGWLGYRRMRSPEVERRVLHAVHPPAYVETIERAAAAGGALDPDTIISRGSFSAALHAAGGATRMVELLLDGSADTAFSAHRPPGHHALASRAMGFCLFNNVAVAARFALQERGLERVMVLDWDVHHGNGTNDLFHSSDQVLFVSIHQSPLWPGSGPAADVGSGAGTGYTVNLPVPPGSGDDVFVSLVAHVAAPLVGAFQPELILVSAGYDAHREDPLADCAVTDEGFAQMARAVRVAGATVSAPVGCVLEGGYAQGALARSVAATLEALAAPTDPTAAARPEGEAVAITPLAEASRRRLSAWWPELSL